MPNTAIWDAIAGVTDELFPVWRGFADMASQDRVAAVDAAITKYDGNLKSQIEKTAPAAGAAIVAAFSAVRQACEDDDSEAFRLQRQTVLKNFLHACYAGTIRSFSAADVEAASSWLAYIASMAKWEDDHEVMVAMTGASAGGASLNRASSLARARLLIWFADQIGIEAEEAIGAMEKGRLFQAHLEAVEAIEFWRAIASDLEETLGAEQAARIKDLVASFYDVTKAKDEAQIVVVSMELKEVMEQASASISNNS